MVSPHMAIEVLTWDFEGQQIFDGDVSFAEVLLDERNHRRPDLGKCLSVVVRTVECTFDIGGDT